MSSISVRGGREGPTYDPYAYEEITVHRPGRPWVTLHQGLIVWIEVEGLERVDGAGAPQIFLELFFEHHAGITPQAARRAIRGLDDRRWRAHYRHDVVHVDGYPGETLVLCRTCDRVIDSHFCEEAIR